MAYTEIIQTEVTHIEGTLGRVYGGACNLLHIPDGRRKDFGAAIAFIVDRAFRQLPANVARPETPLCPGCYMIAMFNATCALAEANGQPLGELCFSMAEAFTSLGTHLEERGGSYDLEAIEEIHVVLDQGYEHG